MRTTILLAALVFAVSGRAQSLFGNGGGGGGSYLPVGVLNGLTNLDDLLNTDPVERPRDFEPRLVLGLGASVQQASITCEAGSADAGTFPWMGAMVEAGASLTYRDRIGLSLLGSWGFTGYMLTLDSMYNRVYHTSKRAEVGLWWLKRAREHRPTRFKFGVALGCSFQHADELVRDENGFRGVTTARQDIRPYLAPEVARFGAEGKDRFEIALRYVINLDGAKGWESTAKLGGSEATYTASDNYLGIVTRYHIGTKRKKPLPLPVPNVPYLDRRTDTLTTMHTPQRRITLRLWDDAEVDGDTISVFLNELPVLSGHELTKKPLRLALDLRHGWNYLMVVAHNEGSVPPSTARGTVRRGKGKETLLIKTSRKHNQVVVIRSE